MVHYLSNILTILNRLTNIILWFRYFSIIRWDFLLILSLFISIWITWLFIFIFKIEHAIIILYFLFIFRGLRRQRVLQCRDSDFIISDEDKISIENNDIEREPWKQTDNISLRFLWWMSKKIRQQQCLAIFHLNFRLFTFNCHNRQSNILLAWWSFTCYR